MYPQWSAESRTWCKLVRAQCMHDSAKPGGTIRSLSMEGGGRTTAFQCEGPTTDIDYLAKG